LSAICSFREAGLSLEDIRKIISSRKSDTTEILLRRLSALSGEIQEFQAKRRMLAGMLKARAPGDIPSSVDKNLFVGMLKAAGLDDAAMRRFHRAFEEREPEAHHAFLLSLDLPKKRCSESADGPQACPGKGGWVSSAPFSHPVRRLLSPRCERFSS
jgi:DNA-binding transcriptional MerR regulator